MDKIYNLLNSYRDNPIIYEDRKDFVDKLYKNNTAKELWTNVNVNQALRVWTHSNELIDREVLGESKWMEVHSLIDAAKESI